MSASLLFVRHFYEDLLFLVLLVLSGFFYKIHSPVLSAVIVFLASLLYLYFLYFEVLHVLYVHVHAFRNTCTPTSLILASGDRRVPISQKCSCLRTPLPTYAIHDVYSAIQHDSVSALVTMATASLECWDVGGPWMKEA